MSENYVKQGIAIINPYGGIWTDKIFQTPQQARKYLEEFWSSTGHDLGKFKLAMATLTVTLDRAPGEPVFIDLPRTDQ